MSKAMSLSRRPTFENAIALNTLSPLISIRAAMVEKRLERSWLRDMFLQRLDPDVAPPALRPPRPRPLPAVDLYRDRPLPPEVLEHFFFVVLRVRAGFAIPLANEQVVDPSGNLRVLPNAPHL